MNKHTAILGGVFSTLGNKYDWSEEVVLAWRVLTVAATVMMFWPGIIYFLLILFKNDL